MEWCGAQSSFGNYTSRAFKFNGDSKNINRDLPVKMQVTRCFLLSRSITNKRNSWNENTYGKSNSSGTPVGNSDQSHLKEITVNRVSTSNTCSYRVAADDPPNFTHLFSVHVPKCTITLSFFVDSCTEEEDIKSGSVFFRTGEFHYENRPSSSRAWNFVLYIQ